MDRLASALSLLCGLGSALWLLYRLGVLCRFAGCKTAHRMRVQIRETGQIVDLHECARCSRFRRVPVQQ